MKRLIFFFIIFSFGKNFIFSIQKLHIIYNSTNTLKNPLFCKKNKKLALLLTKRACKGGIIMKKIVLLFVALG